MKNIIIMFFLTISIGAFSQTKLPPQDTARQNADARKYVADKLKEKARQDSVKIAQKKLVKQPAKPKDNDK